MLQGPTPRNEPGDSHRSEAPDNFSFILGSDAEKAFGFSPRSLIRIRNEASFASIRMAYDNLDPYAERYSKTKITFPMLLALPYLIEGQPDYNDLQKIRLIVDSCRYNVLTGIHSYESGKKADMVMSVLPIILISKALAGCREDQQGLQTALKDNIDRTLEFVHNFTCHTVDTFTGNPRSIRDWIGEILQEYLTLEHSAAEAACFRDLIEKISDQRTYDTIVHRIENSSPAAGEREDNLAFRALSDQFFAEGQERGDQNLVLISDLILEMSDKLADILKAQRSRYDASLTSFDLLEEDYRESGKPNIYFNLNNLTTKDIHRFLQALFDSGLPTDKKHLLVNLELFAEFKHFHRLMSSMSGVNYEFLKRQINEYFNVNPEKIDDFRIYLGRRLKGADEGRDFSVVLADPNVRSLFSCLDGIKKVQLQSKYELTVLVFDQFQRHLLLDNAFKVIALDTVDRPSSESPLYRIKVEHCPGSHPHRFFSFLANVIASIPKSEGVEFLKFSDPALRDLLRTYDRRLIQATGSQFGLYRDNIGSPSPSLSKVLPDNDGALYFINRDDEGRGRAEVDAPVPNEGVDLDELYFVR